MKNQKLLLKKMSGVSLMLLLFLFFSNCASGDKIFSTDVWNITYDDQQGGIALTYKSKNICNGMYASYQWEGKEIKTTDYARHKISTGKVSDSFGKGHIYKVEYTDKELPKLTQYFYLYPGKEYILTDFTVEAKEEIRSGRMAPVNVDSISGFLQAGDNRALFVPFDNDKWIRYQSHPLGFDTLVSYEVTAIFNNESRNGLVVGSVEHDNWKTGISIGKGDRDNIGSLVCYGGIADEQTRDVKAHGALAGKKIKSPKVFLGFFENWCDGLEAYAKANAVIAPPKAWEKAVPFGWNSWGALQFNLTYEKAMEVSDYFKENLQNNHFVNPDQTVYIGLDSGWDCMNEEQLKSFIEKCKSNGQIGGIYWTPFTDWARDPERTVDAAPEYKYKDIYLYANGKPQELDGAYAVDPTHPAVEAMMKKTSGLFHRAGFEYVKMDFMTHGAMEADKWYNPEITTGIQGYNYGNGYISWAIQKYGGYTEANAQEFSKIMQKKLGWSRYGNPKYVSAVYRYLVFSSNGKWGSPFVGRNWNSVVSSEFGWRTDPLNGKKAFHEGLDIAYPSGTKIHAVSGGVVTSVVYSKTGYGHHVRVDCGNGVTVLYAHCSKILVTKGQSISTGQAIAEVGATGRVTGAHLHLGVLVNGKEVNPREYIGG